MSADLWLTLQGRTGQEVDVYHLNVTYNLTPMLTKAGWVWPNQPTEADDPVFGKLKGPCWSREHLEGARAADIGEKAMFVLHNLKTDPDGYRALNPPNGWGDYDGLVQMWEEFVGAIREWPEAVIHTWF